MQKRQRSTKRARPARDKNDRRSADREEHLDRLLDEALAATFPASDPVSTLTPEETPSDSKPPKMRRHFASV